MSWSKSIGSNREDAKQINLDLSKKRVRYPLIIGVILFWGLIMILVTSLMSSSFESEEFDYAFKCTNGSIEKIEFEKEYYCGDHYTVLEGRISKYSEVEHFIKYGVQLEE